MLRIRNDQRPYYSRDVRDYVVLRTSLFQCKRETTILANYYSMKISSSASSELSLQRLV